MAVSSKVESLLSQRILKEKPKNEDWPSFRNLFIFTFLLNRDAPLYIINQASQQLLPNLNNLVGYLADIRTYLDDLRSPDVDPNTSSLSRAYRHLQAYRAAVLGGGVTSREKQSLSRFQDAVEEFSGSIKSAAGTNLSREEALEEITSLNNSIKEEEEKLVIKADIISSSLSTYSALNLSGRGTALVADRGVKALEAVEDRFGAGTANIRDELENIMSVSTVVRAVSQQKTLASVALSSTGFASGTGDPAQVDSSLSGPYDVDASADTLRLNVDGTNWDVTLDHAEAPTVDTVDSGGNFPITAGGGPNIPVGGAYVRVGLDGGAPVDYAFPSLGPFPAAAPASITTANVAGDLAGAPFTVTDTGSLNIFTGNDVGEDRKLTIHIEDPDFTVGGSTNIGGFLFLGYAAYAGAAAPMGMPVTSITDIGTWTSSFDIEEAVEIQSPAVIEITRTNLGKGDFAEFTSPNLRLITVDGRSDEIAVENGSNVISSDQVNFENLGAEVGDLLRLSIPPHGAPQTEYHQISAVAGGSVTLSANTALATSAVGRATVYPDTSQIAVGDILSVSSGDVSERFTISSVTNDLVSVDTTFPASLPATPDIQFSIDRELIEIKSDTNGTDSSLSIGSPANDASGLFGIGGAAARGTVSSFSDASEDFVLEGIRQGDILNASGTHTISAVSTALTLTDKVINNFSGAYTITNPDYDNYETFASALGNWLNSYRDLSETIDSVLNRVLNDTPPQETLDSIDGLLSSYIVYYQSLVTSINNYSCRDLPAVQDLIKLLNSSGLDRAIDKLKQADFSTFFSMEPEDSTYAGYFAKTARQTIAEYGNLDRYKDLIKVELDNFVFPDDLLDLE